MQRSDGSAPIDASAAAQEGAPFDEVADALGLTTWVLQLLPAYRTLHTSPDLAALWGRPLDELLAHPRAWFEAIDRADVLRVRGIWAAWRATQLQAPRFDLEYRLYLPDGTRRWVRHRGVGLRDAEGRLLRLVSVFEDIDDRKRVESERERLRQLLDQIVQGLPQLTWVSRADGKVWLLSRRFCDYTGRDAEALNTEGLAWLLHPDEHGTVIPAWREAVANHRPFRHALRMRRHDGEYRWFETTAVPLQDERGASIGWFGLSNDIHDRRLAMRALQDEGRRLQALIETSPAVVCTLHRRADGRLQFGFGAERVAALYGVEADALREDAGAVFQRLLHPDEFGPVMQEVARSADTFGAWQATYRMRQADGSERWFEGHSVPVKDDDGNLAWHGTVADVTRRKLQEAELQRLNSGLEQRVAERTAELQAAVKELEAFSYSVSHDLRAPLRALDGFSQALLAEHLPLLPDKAQRYLRIIRESAQKMGQLIDDLLTFSRLGRAPLSRRTIDPALLVRDAMNQLAPMTEGRRIELRVGELAPCEGDLALLRQVWINLLGNAVKYTRGRDPAIIEVSSRSAADTGPVYCIRDNGAGFDMRYAHKLFGVFERLHRADEFEGTGVGLAIVQRIVRRHGGDVHAEAVPGQGATFTFHLGPGSPAS